MVAPGEHTVTFRLACADTSISISSKPRSRPTCPSRCRRRPNLSPALDYSTDHTYKLSPERLLLDFRRARLRWSDERVSRRVLVGISGKREGANFPTVTVQFDGEFVAGDQVFLTIGGQAVRQIGISK